MTETKMAQPYILTTKQFVRGTLVMLGLAGAMYLSRACRDESGIASRTNPSIEQTVEPESQARYESRMAIRRERAEAERQRAEHQARENAKPICPPVLEIVPTKRSVDNLLGSVDQVLYDFINECQDNGPEHNLSFHTSDRDLYYKRATNLKIKTIEELIKKGMIDESGKFVCRPSPNDKTKYVALFRHEIAPSFYCYNNDQACAPALRGCEGQAVVARDWKYNPSKSYEGKTVFCSEGYQISEKTSGRHLGLYQKTFCKEVSPAKNTLPPTPKNYPQAFEKQRIGRLQQHQKR